MGGRAGGGARGGGLSGAYDRAYSAAKKTLGPSISAQVKNMTTEQLKGYLDRIHSEGRLVGKSVITKNKGIPQDEIAGVMDNIVVNALKYNAVKAEYKRRK